MTKNLVVVDIDNTVHESDITMNRVSMELFNSPFRWCQQNEWYTGADPKMPMEHALQVFSRLHDRDMIFLTEPYVGSVAGLKRIMDAGYEVAYYTDRKADAHDDTHDWLVEYGFPNADNLFCCRDKRGAIAEVKDRLATIIDDRPRTMIFGRYELGLEKVFSLRQPYNRNLTDIPGVFLRDTWAELTDTFLSEMGANDEEG